jgi:hyperosmotically inducible periplasmic protein
VLRNILAPERLLVLALVSLLSGACSQATFDTHDDLTISAHVKTALLDDPAVGGLRLGVETFQRVVTLSGRVPTDADRDRAVARARKVPGVKDVKSSLEVRP